jgi:AmmeMemoRadiSam system protein B
MKSIVLLFVGVLLMFSQSMDIRPIRDDIGYCWTLSCMDKLIKYVEANYKYDLSDKQIIAGIAPHDDYLYAGAIYYPLFKNIKAKEVVLFGVTHKTVRDAIGDPNNVLIFEEYGAWRGLKKEVKISSLREYIKNHMNKESYLVSNKAHELEHSIEAEIPFLSYFNEDIKITPIMVTGMPYERMNELSAELADVIINYIKENKLELGKDIAFVISADANHYGKDFNNVPYGEDEKAHVKAIQQDIDWVNNYLINDVNEEKIELLTGKLWGKTYKEYGNSYWCGKYSIPFGMLTIIKVLRGVRGSLPNGILLKFGDTYSGGALPISPAGCGTTAPFSLKHWVSFFSIAYY